MPSNRRQLFQACERASFPVFQAIGMADYKKRGKLQALSSPDPERDVRHLKSLKIMPLTCQLVLLQWS